MLDLNKPIRPTFIPVSGQQSVCSVQMFSLSLLFCPLEVQLSHEAITLLFRTSGEKVVHPVTAFNLGSVDHHDESLIYSPPTSTALVNQPSQHSSLVPPITVPLSIHFYMKWSVYIFFDKWARLFTCEGNHFYMKWSVYKNISTSSFSRSYLCILSKLADSSCLYLTCCDVT